LASGNTSNNARKGLEVKRPNDMQLQPNAVEVGISKNECVPPPQPK
jgi:hypothetical protein